MIKILSVIKHTLFISLFKNDQNLFINQSAFKIKAKTKVTTNAEDKKKMSLTYHACIARWLRKHKPCRLRNTHLQSVLAETFDDSTSEVQVESFPQYSLF